MICIFSTSTDYSTTEVVKWLRYFGESDVLRVNSDTDRDFSFDIEDAEFCLTADGRHLRIADFRAVWYRKGSHWVVNQFPPVSLPQHKSLSEHLNARLRSEEINLAEYLHHVISMRVPTLGSPTKSTLNKLMVLHKARQVGLLTPRTFVANTLAGVRQIFEKNDGVVTKAISETIYYFDKGDTKCGYFSYTEKLDYDLLSCLQTNIPPSLFQEQINKHFEVRAFFLVDTFYATAILSQSDPQTLIDFRKYNDHKHTRNVPFTLPPEIASRLKSLFAELNLDTGSVDLLVGYATENSIFWRSIR